MANQLFQWNFVVQGLIPEPIKLKQKIWLEKGKLLLEKSGNTLDVHILGDRESRYQNSEHITQYLRIASLISGNQTELIDRGGFSLDSKKEFGKRPKFQLLHTKLTQHIPDEIASDIEDQAPKFIRFIGKIHRDYAQIIEANGFIGLAMSFFYNASQSLYSTEGFVNSAICLESLFNDGPSDIKYKLAQRASLLIGMCGIDPIGTAEKISHLYNIRSKIVHGTETKLQFEDAAQINEYARLSVVLFLILLNNEKRKGIKKSERKTNILKEIDFAMLDETRRRPLKLEIQKGLKQFKPPVPRSFEKPIDGEQYRVSPW